MFAGKCLEMFFWKIFGVLCIIEYSGSLDEGGNNYDDDTPPCVFSL